MRNAINNTDWEAFEDTFNAECRNRKANAASRRSVSRVTDTKRQKERHDRVSIKRIFAEMA